LGQLSVSYLKELTAEANWFDRTKPENLGSLGANDKINYVEFVRRSKVPRKVVIIGDLFGSFVSLIRILNELKKLGYIDDELHLQENVELLFTGNFFGKNKLVMETLFIIFTLKQINPSSVFICGGKNERPEKLEKILASKKLFRTIFSSKNSEEIILIKNSLSSLFSLLPTAVTLFIRKKFITVGSFLALAAANRTCLRKFKANKFLDIESFPNFIPAWSKLKGKSRFKSTTEELVNFSEDGLKEKGHLFSFVSARESLLNKTGISILKHIAKLPGVNQKPKTEEEISRFWYSPMVEKVHEDESLYKNKLELSDIKIALQPIVSVSSSPSYFLSKERWRQKLNTQLKNHTRGKVPQKRHDKQSNSDESDQIDSSSDSSYEKIIKKRSTSTDDSFAVVTCRYTKSKNSEKNRFKFKQKEYTLECYLIEKKIEESEREEFYRKEIPLINFINNFLSGTDN